MASSVNDKILDQAHDDFEKVSEFSFENRKTFKENMQFAFNIGSGQWNSTDIEARDDAGRPHLTFNKLGKFVAQVVNYERNITNLDEIIPVDDKGDIQTAKIYNEIIRDIEYRSSADEVYASAGEHAVAGGFGYWRIRSKYIDYGFDQEIVIEWLKNPLNVFLDPRGNFAFIREAIPVSEFKIDHPDFDIKKAGAALDSEEKELWYDNDKVWIAEYFRKEPTTRTIVEVVDKKGETQIYEITKQNEKKIRKLQVVREREYKTTKIMWYKMTGDTIIAKKEWPGNYIPIVEVVGHEIWLDGECYKKSLISDAKDPAKAFNYWITSQTEKAAMSPKAPYMVTPQQIEGHREMWDSANINNPMYLLYNRTTEGAPKRNDPPAIDIGAQNMMMIADTGIKDVLGMYESAIGDRSNERSGKAIIARNARSDQGTFQFPDNLRRAKVLTKKILVDLIPRIYDNARVVRLMSPEAGSQTIEINKEEMINGVIVKLNDLSRGRYDIRVKVTPNPSRRQQIAENVLQAMQYSPPEYAPILLPVLFKHADVEGADEIIMAIQAKDAQLQQQAQIEQANKSGNQAIPTGMEGLI